MLRCSTRVRVRRPGSCAELDRRCGATAEVPWAECSSWGIAVSRPQEQTASHGIARALPGDSVRLRHVLTDRPLSGLRIARQRAAKESGGPS